jgi:hypothetical protein
MKNIIERWLLSFDNKDETGFDYKKLTALWGVLASTFLLGSYCLKEVKFYWLGVSMIVKDDLPEFKWILGMILAFILTLVYFTNSKTLTEFIEKIKLNKKEDAEHKE